MHTESTTTSTKNRATTKPLPADVFRYKTCRHCGEEKPLTGFYKQNGNPQVYRADCIACMRAEAQSRRRRRQNAPRTERRCPKCITLRPVAQFGKDERRLSGVALICVHCERRRAGKRE